ncbi:L-aspartate dehydrogenase [Durusdinium trenchii]|uniref:Aspartate dehydrogenase domain-containing protein n=1 Tax=Durusdinium trenchii TaxID=1381693 RepID=A0ABP0JRL2_9DINO
MARDGCIDELLGELQHFLQGQLEVTRAAEGKELDFDYQKWWQWRQLRSEWTQTRSREQSLKEALPCTWLKTAADKARSTWKQQLASSRTAQESQVPFGLLCDLPKLDRPSSESQTLKASSLARLCTFTAEQVLPSPEQFFMSKGLWPDTGDLRVQEFCQLFLLIALEKWVARLAEEAVAEGPSVDMAADATKQRSMEMRAEREVREVEQPNTDAHPLILLQHIPGGEPAVRSILQAKHKARQMEFESNVIIRICCGESQSRSESDRPPGPSVTNLLAKAVEETLNLQTALTEAKRVKALEVLRMVQHLCSDQRRMLSFWALSDASSGYVKPKLKLFYYLSPECPQTIVDLVSPPLRELNWACTVAPSSLPIFVWEGSRRSIDPMPTLSRGGLVNRVSGVSSITTKVGMLKALHSLCNRLQTTFPPPWYSTTFELPMDLETWKRHAEENPDKRWIYKPNGSLTEQKRSALVQRWYVLVRRISDARLIARVKPLLVYLHGAAYAKVCGQEFDAASFSQADLFRHVTEQEFQKQGYAVHKDWKAINLQVWPVMLLRDLARELHSDTGEEMALAWLSSFWEQARAICIQVVDSIRESLSDCQLGMFEILGLDFIRKADGHVIFLEANRDPSWVIDGGAKQAIIPALVRDLLSIVLRSHGDGAEKCPILSSGGHEFDFEILVDEAEKHFVTMLALPVRNCASLLRCNFIRAMSAQGNEKKRRLEGLSIGLVGLGSIGQVVAENLTKGSLSGLSGVSLSAVIVQKERTERPPELGATALLTTKVEDFMAADWSLCVEAAGQSWVRHHGKTVLGTGRDLLVTSVGVFTDDDLLEDLTTTARMSHSRLLLPAGAMPGLDWMSSAALDEVKVITLEQRKRPEGWRGTPAEKSLDLENVTEATTVFQGPAREAASQFPKNANIAAALALGTVGLDRLQVRLVADPTVPGPTNKVTLEGSCGELTLEVRGRPLSQRTSRIVPFSVLKALKNLASPVSIGL